MLHFKALERSDFKILHAWLNLDFITKWYSKRKFTYDDVERKFDPYVKGFAPTESYIVYSDSEPIAYIQTYAISDYPEYASCVDVGKNTAGIDFFIGNKEFLHKGYAKEILNQFIETIVFRKKEINSCIVGPESDNVSAIRAYEKAGFSFLKLVHCKGEEKEEYVMIRRKNENKVIYKSTK